jgi:heat shock protein beta
MAAQAEAENDPMYDMMKNLPKVLEINPKSPLIEGMLDRVLDMPADGDDSADSQELKEAVRVLFDTTLVRSGFSVPDPARSVVLVLNVLRCWRDSYFDRVEAMLRRSIGVSLSAKGAAHVRPAPPIAMGPLGEEGVDGDDDEDVPGDDEWTDWHAIKDQLTHDEL